MSTTEQSVEELPALPVLVNCGGAAYASSAPAVPLVSASRRR
jgi:hypothetical protein